MSERDNLLRGVETLGIAIEDSAVDTLLGYLELLRHWNRSIRLVGDAERADAVDIILVDSLAPLMALGESATTAVDVGSGAGLPGIPIAIARPTLRVTTIEPIHKKHAFQRTARRELGLQNLEARCERVEDHPSERRYDFVMSRATFAPEEWMERASALTAPGGVSVALVNRREDVPTGCEEHPYEVGGKKRLLAIRRNPPG